MTDPASATPLPEGWREHTARYPECGSCFSTIKPQYGADGDVIVAIGFCEDCRVWTMWPLVTTADGDAS